ncbi:MAG TPA: hypothetical protein DCZ91_04810 [Lachnospiraceae bacterium]|nr:hypothetical protein [Lachnospiraceae bacterium]
MGYKAYEKFINLGLMWQMKDMIAKATGVKPLGVRRRKPLFKRRNVLESMESKFGFRYPGEVLERYHERCGDTVQNLRALAIAVADEKEYLEDCMFIGNQKAAFIRKIRENAREDIYLQAALCVLTERKAEKERLVAELKQYKPHDSQEFFYLKSALRGLAPVCGEDMNGFSYFLGEGRTMETYGNEKIFSWAVEFAESARSGSCKMTGIMRCLSRLQFHQVKEGNIYWEGLRKAGYTCQEIMYLNMELPFLAESDEALTKESIVAERIAAQACESILKADYIENPALRQSVANCLFLYDNFSIKLEGCRSLSEWLRNKVKIRDVDLFLDFYNQRRNPAICANWIWVNLSDNRWDRLISSMPREEYTELFEECFLFCGERDSRTWLDKYEKLCGESYFSRFWEEGGCYTNRVFNKLAEEGLIDLADHIARYAEDIEKLGRAEADGKWSHMLQYIAKKAEKLDCHAVFCFWDVYDRLFGMEALREFVKDEGLVSSAIGFSLTRYSQPYYSVGSRFWTDLDFLSAEEQRKLFGWADDEIYLHSPEHYNTFLLEFLEKKGTDLFPKEQCRTLVDVLLSTIKPDGYKARSLRDKYYEKEEIEKLAELDRIHRAEEEERRIEKKKKEWRQNLYKGTDTDTGRSRLGIIAENFNIFISGKIYREIAYSCIQKEINQGNSKIECSRLRDLLEVMGSLVENGVYGWDIICGLINRLEVEDDRLEKNKNED